MRRIASACTTESHPLYAPFMAMLSAAIFVWDPDDLNALYKAKREEIAAHGITDFSSFQPEKQVTNESKPFLIQN